MEHEFWLVGFRRMAGFVLSGNGIRVFVFGNLALRWSVYEKKYTSVYTVGVW